MYMYVLTIVILIPTYRVYRLYDTASDKNTGDGNSLGTRLTLDHIQGYAECAYSTTYHPSLLRFCPHTLCTCTVPIIMHPSSDSDHIHCACVQYQLSPIPPQILSTTMVSAISPTSQSSLTPPLTSSMPGPSSSYRTVMGCRLCQNPTFHEDMILDGYLEKWMWTFAK